MTSSQSLIYGVLALAIFINVTAEESSQKAGWQFPSVTGGGSFSYGGIDFPNFGGLSGSESGSSGLKFPGFSGLSGLFGRTTSTAAPASSTTASGRKRRETDDDETEHNELQSRLFFSRFPVITSCNYNDQAGNTCLSCRQALNCLPNNLGLLTNCAGLFRYCNNGRCSLFQGSACSATTSTSSTSSSTSSSSSTSTSSTSSTSTSTTLSG